VGRAVLLLFVSLLPAAAWGQAFQPMINASAVPEPVRVLDIEEIEANEPILLSWSAQIQPTVAYDYELSYDVNVLSSTVSPESVRITLEGDPEAVG
jgi:hypothetical protein